MGQKNIELMIGSSKADFWSGFVGIKITSRKKLHLWLYSAILIVTVGKSLIPFEGLKPVVMYPAHLRVYLLENH